MGFDTFASDVKRLWRAALLIILASFSLPSLAVISFVDSVTARGNNDLTDIAVPAGAITNDLILAQITYRNRAGGDSVSAPSGWTQIGALQQDGDVFQAIYYKLASSTDAGTTYRWDFEGNGNRRFVSGLTVLRGVDFANPVADSGAQDGSSGPVLTAPSVNAANVNTALLAFYTVEAGNQSYTPAGSMTEIYDVEGGNTGNGLTSMAAYEFNVAAGASGSRTATTTINNDDANSFLIALNEGTAAFPTIDNIGGSCGTDELMIVQFSSDVSDAVLDPGLFTLSVGTVSSVTRQSSDTVILAVSGLLEGVSTTVSFEGNDTDVSFQGLLGRYFDQRDGGGSKVNPFAGIFTGNEYLRLDAQVNFAWENATPSIFPNVSGNGDRFSIRWTGSLIPDVSGDYEFRLYSDDGVRLNFEGTEIISDWSNHAPRYSATSAVQTLVAGQRYAIQMEHFENTGRAVAQLEWRRDGGAWENIPITNLSTCAASTIYTDIAFWDFNQTEWTGTANEVLDSGPNAYHGTAVNGATTADATPAVSGDPGTCQYGVFDDAGSTTGNYIELPNFPNLSTDFTMSAWIRTEDRSQRGQRIFADDESGLGFALSLGDPGAGRLRFFSRAISPVSLDTNAVIDNDTWYFVAGVADITNSTRTIYVFAEDGSLLETASVSHTGSWGTTNGVASIGGETNSGEALNRFLGNIDSVRITDGALDQAAITALISETQPCNPLNAVLDYRFDESLWEGTADEVLDSTGNNGSGTAVGGANTIAAGQICRAGQFDGVDDYVELGAGTLDALRSTASLSFWIQTTQTGNNTGWQAPGIAGVEQSGGSDDIFWGWIDASGRIGLSLGNDYAADTKSTTSINDGVFHHVVLTRDATTGAYKIYVDGVLEQSQTGATGNIGNTFSSLGRIEDTGGSPVYFQGVLDEVKVFDSVLTDDNVTELFNDSRVCAGASLAHFAFEQSAWSGAGVVIEDYSGNGRTGISVGNVLDNPDGYVCQGVTIPNNTASGTIDAINSRQDINDELGSEGTIMFWYRSEQDWIGSGDRTLMDATIRVTNNAADKYFFLSKEDDGQLRFAMEDSADRDFNLRSPVQSFAALTWVHITVTYDLPNDQLEIYVNGTRVANQTVNSSGVLGELGEIYFGDAQTNYVTPGSSANGTMDELKLFTGVLDSDEIMVEMNDAHPCLSSCTLDSFGIAQPDYGLACPQTRAAITLTALCADGSTKTDYAGTVMLSSDENTASSFFDNSSGGSVVTETVFDGSEGGTKQVYLFHNNVNTALLVTADDGTVSTASTDSTEFGANGFVASAPTSFACGGSTSVTLTAIGQDTSGGGTCSQLTGFSGVKNLKVWSEINIDPLESPSVADSGLPNQMTVNSNSIGSTQPGSNNTSANFINGQGSLNIEYLDVGEILGINVRHDDSPYDGSVPEFSALVSTLDPFVVSPAAVEVSTNLSSCTAVNPADCPVLADAGSNFTTTTRAVCSDSGVSTAESYRGTVNLSHTLVAPAGGNLGANLPVNQVILDGSEATAGEEVSVNQQISEVGVFTLTASAAASYFGRTVAPSTTANIGRFIPDRFTLAATDGSFANACTNFTYIGQPFTYDVAPSLRITAVNDLGVTTQNYTHPDFIKLLAADIERGFPAADTSQDGLDGVTKLPVTSNPNGGNLSIDSPGVMVYDFDSTDTYFFDKDDANSLVAPFDADLSIELTRLEDDDAVVPAALTNWNPAAIELRYGRWRMENVFGPETESLAMVSRAEYYDGTTFQINDADNCTVIESFMTVTGSDGSNTTLSGSSFPSIVAGSSTTDLDLDSPVSNGNGNFVFSAPGAGGSGESVSVTLDFSSAEWLQFDWNGTGVVDPPVRSATFGQYRGHDRIIYWREVR